jgi:hypothetical protein
LDWEQSFWWYSYFFANTEFFSIKNSGRAKKGAGLKKTRRKERPMRKKLIPLLILLGTLMTFLTCSSQPLPDKGITILSPKANDIFKAGDFYQILWKAEPTASEFGTMVTVEFSKDGGKSWETVELNIPANGEYLWKVPKMDSAQCKVRVFSQYRPTYRGTSEIFSVK